MAIHIDPSLLKTVILFSSSLAIVPLFKKIGLGAVMGYLVAGFLIGPFGLGVFTEPTNIIHFAEMGVVMFLFIIGLEMQPHKLKGMKKDIITYGFMQVILALGILTLGGIYIFQYEPKVAFIAGAGFVLSSTAIIMSTMTEKGISNTPKGQRIFATLLFEDLSIVPLLAIVSLLAPKLIATNASNESFINTSLIALGGVSLLVFSGKWLLDPLFKVISKAHVRELMTGGALFVVLSSALIMEMVGLSMAMGAFVAGIMLSESSFRHQIEADIEPFKGLLLGLFFMGVGMSLDLNIVSQHLMLLLGMVVTYIICKATGIYIVARILNKDKNEALFRMFTMAHGGEFAFVLFNTATTSNILNDETSSILTATVIISMVLNPILGIVYNKISSRNNKQLEAKNIEKQDKVNINQLDKKKNILIIGFSSFSQLVSQLLIAREDLNVTIIDKNINMIQAASKFGFKVFYGDATNPNSLHACGVENAHMVLVCTNDGNTNVNIVKYIKHKYPLIKVFAVAKDRFNALDLTNNHVDYFIKEAFESSLKFGEAVLKSLEIDDYQIQESIKLIREIDKERFSEELAGGEVSGELAKKYMAKYKKSLPEPYIKPKTEAEALNNITKTILNQAEIHDKTNSKLQDLNNAEINIKETNSKTE